MTPEDYQWNIGMVMDRYSWLQLSFEQAERVYKMEQDTQLSNVQYYFSEWEEWDYELATFQEILQPDQLAIYEKEIKERMERHAQSMKEQDQGRLNEIAYHEELLHFYETRFVPDLLKDNVLAVIRNTGEQKLKIDYIRAEYKRFLDAEKKGILTNHFRFHRTFQPNYLKLSLLQHRLLYIYPNYHRFKHQMDEPTKAMVDFLLNRFRYGFTGSLEVIKQKEKELYAFSAPLLEKYYTDKGGWHAWGVEYTEEERKEEHIMILLLLDKDRYGLDA